MKSKVFTFAIGLFMATLGGFVGFSPNSPSQTTFAAEKTMIRWVDVPKPIIDLEALSHRGRSIEIDMQNETVSLNGDVDNTTVTISRDVETRPEYVTKIVRDTVYSYRRDSYEINRLFDRLMPIENAGLVIPSTHHNLPKINADR